MRTEPPHRVELIALGIIAAISGLLILIGGWLVWVTPSGSIPWLLGPPVQALGGWNFWGGEVCGALLILLGLALARWPEHHPTIGAATIIVAGLSLLAGPLLWIGFLLGIVAGATAIVVGSPASTKFYYYTPMHVTLGAPPAPAPMTVPGPSPATPAAPPVVAGRFCQTCGRSVSSEAEFCPWCGASQTARPS